MDRFAVFVDAGYLFAASKSYFIEHIQEDAADVRLDFQQFISVITDLSETLTGKQILRIYWYDASQDGLPTRTHEALAFMDHIKLRLGMFNGAGQQKGVDTMIVADLLTLARNRAISDAVLLSGDVDLLVGVLQAQELGVRVHLVGLEGHSQRNQSARLKWDCDTTRNLSDEDIRAFTSPLIRRQDLSSRIAASYAAAAADVPVIPVGEVDWPQVAAQITEIFTPPERARIGSLTKYAHWGARLHGKMLGICKSIIGRETLHDEQQLLREMVWKRCREAPLHPLPSIEEIANIYNAPISTDDPAPTSTTADNAPRASGLPVAALPTPPSLRERERPAASRRIPKQVVVLDAPPIRVPGNHSDEDSAAQEEERLAQERDAPQAEPQAQAAKHSAPLDAPTQDAPTETQADAQELPPRDDT
jgi:uncharacterized LabA/DUF88 family protein